jgi:predicted metal-dependent hydrolase
MTTIKGDGFIVNIITSKRRKTMALKVDAKGVSVLIPPSLSIATAKQFISQKTNWIKKKLAQQSQQIIADKQFIDGEFFLLLGDELSLRLYEEDSAPTTKKSASTIAFYGRLNKLSKPAIRAAIITWYKKQADDYLTARTQWLSDVTGLHPNSVTIKSYKARWGSCSSKGDINFNWHLIQAPQVIVDYVIIHELCHLTHHNHSKHFWDLVAHFSPDYKLHRQWLKDNGYTLSF